MSGLRRQDEPSTLDRVLAEVNRQVANFPPEHRAAWDETLREAEESAGADTLDVTIAELEADGKLHDRVLRSICLNADVDYVGAISWLDERANQRAIVTNDPGSVRLSEALEAGGLSLNAIRRDASKIALAEEQNEDAIELATRRHPDEDEVDEVKVNSKGEVLFGDDVDVAKLTTDPYWLEHFYARAMKVDKAYVAEKDAFVKDFIEHARQGIDMVATIEREKGLIETKLARQDAETKLARREEQEREKRAERRDAERQITELSKRL